MDSARYGIQTLAPQLFDGAEPDVVVSGPNVGSAYSLHALATLPLAQIAMQQTQGRPS